MKEDLKHNASSLLIGKEKDQSLLPERKYETFETLSLAAKHDAYPSRTAIKLTSESREIVAFQVRCTETYCDGNSHRSIKTS
jgi:hypothetical protein